MANPSSSLVDPGAPRRGGNKSGSSVKSEPFGHLIEHIKQTDPMLWEALRRASSQINSLANFGSLVTPPLQAAQIHHRTLLVKDTTVGNDIADRVPVQWPGTLFRAVGVLRKTIIAPLTIRVNKNSQPLFTATIPIGSPGQTAEFDFPGPNSTAPLDMGDEEVLSWDITASDGSADANGVASLTVEWTSKQNLTSIQEPPTKKSQVLNMQP